jgi:hypothetical protein
MPGRERADQVVRPQQAMGTIVDERKIGPLSAKEIKPFSDE